MARRTARVRWTAPAKNDAIDAHAYIRARDPVAAARYADDLLRAIRRLRSFPRIGAPLTNLPLEGDVRSIVVRNHRVIYRVEPGLIWVLRVWDCRNDPEDLWRFFEARVDEEAHEARPPSRGRATRPPRRR